MDVERLIPLRLPAHGLTASGRSVQCPSAILLPVSLTQGLCRPSIKFALKD